MNSSVGSWMPPTPCMAYYELSTCDLYLISAVTNKSLDGWDIVGLSFGVKLQLF